MASRTIQRTRASTIATIVFATALLVALVHLTSVLLGAWYAPAYTSMPNCYREADPSYPAEVVVASSGYEVFSLVPLGVNCIYFDPVTGARLGSHGPDSWGPTIDAGVTVAAAVVFAGPITIQLRRRRTPSR